MTMPTCPACQAVSTDPSSAYCSRCGFQLGAPASAARPPRPRWYHNIWFVLAMLLLVLGPFGLPMVWGNPRFSRWVKYLLTIGMVFYTVGLIKVTVQMVQAIGQAATQFNSTLHF